MRPGRTKKPKADGNMIRFPLTYTNTHSGCSGPCILLNFRMSSHWPQVKKKKKLLYFIVVFTFWANLASCQPRIAIDQSATADYHMYSTWSIRVISARVQVIKMWPEKSHPPSEYSRDLISSVHRSQRKVL